MTGKRKLLEVHSHHFITGPRANGMFVPKLQRTTSEFEHSHVGGDAAHEHEHTGPSCYTIDKDDWFRTTGLRGGGRKKFTAKPVGEQFPSQRNLTDEEQTFDVIVGSPPKEFEGTGGGMSAAARMIMAFHMNANVSPSAKATGDGHG